MNSEWNPVPTEDELRAEVAARMAATAGEPSWTKGYAVCAAHAAEALEYFLTAGPASVRLRRVIGDKLFSCSCGAGARFYLRELSPAELAGEAAAR